MCASVDMGVVPNKRICFCLYFVCVPSCTYVGVCMQPYIVVCACVHTSVYLCVAGDVSILRLITTLFPASCFCPSLRLCGSCVGTLWIASPPKHAGPCYPAIHLCY